MSEMNLNILHSIFNSIREEWSLTGSNILSKDKLFNDYLSLFSQEELTPNIYEEKQRDLDDVLHSLQVSSLLEIQSETIISNIQFDSIVSGFMPALEDVDVINSTPESIKSLLHEYVKDSGDYIYTILEKEGIFRFTKKGFASPCIGDELKLLTDLVLTQIEIADSKQIQYGIYDTEITAKEIIRGSTLTNDSLKLQTEYALHKLLADGYLLPLSVKGNKRTWIFRSRIAEITRLVYNVKQRMNEKRNVDQSKSLVRSLKLEVRDRKFPKRNISIHDAIETLKTTILTEGCFSEKEVNRCANILEESLLSNHFSYIAEYQVRSFKTIMSHLLKNEDENSGFVLTAGTGMGKTLSYMVPLLYYCLLNTENGTKALNIYPRIRLAENQLAGFVKILAEINDRHPARKITIGIDYSGTPYSHDAFKRANYKPNNKTLIENYTDRLWTVCENKGYINPYVKCPYCGEHMLGIPFDASKGEPLTCFACDKKVDWISYTKNSNFENPPDIYIVTTEMLNKHLLSQNAQAVFGDNTFTAPKLVMVDEIHLHTSLKGSHISMLLRRLLKRIELGVKNNPNSKGVPYVVGLSATIGKPKAFFQELTGVRESHITHEEPLPHELEKQGAEYFLFVKPEISSDAQVLSTLLQTSMCVLHNMPQKESEGEQSRFKSLGFVDSLDQVRRWHDDLDDAEGHRRLYTFRDPAKIKVSKELQNFTNQKSPSGYKCAECRTQIDTHCPLYQNGECWWFMRFSNGKENNILPLKVESLTAGEGKILPKYDLMITTSAMEVGYDDPDIMCIIQYQSPLNMASFAQRKGRAGRGLRNRPITIAVLSPYKTKDVYYYQNHHYLTDPYYEKPPLNSGNLSILKIHGLYAELDKIAYLTHISPTSQQVGAQFPFNYTFNKRKNELDELRSKGDLKYVKEVLWEQAPDISRSVDDLFDKLCNELGVVWDKQKKPNNTVNLTKILPNDIPANLFTTLNLPAVTICDYYPRNDLQSNYGWKSYRYQKQCSFNADDPKQFLALVDEGKCTTKVVNTMFQCEDSVCVINNLEKDIDINLGLSTTSIGKVTLRYKSGPAWLPPIYVSNTDTSVKQVDICKNFLQTGEHRNNELYNPKIGLDTVPKSLREYLPHVSHDSPLSVFRPDIIRLRAFNDNNGDPDWIYCPESKSVCNGRDSEEYKKLNGEIYKTLTHQSVTYPQSFYTTNLDTSKLNRTETYASIVQAQYGDEIGTHLAFGPFSNIFSSMHFANAETKQYIDAVHAIVGNSGSLKYNGGGEEIRFGLCQTLDPEFGTVQDVALGYKLVTDGIELQLDSDFINTTIPELAVKNEALYEDLLSYIFSSELFMKNRGPEGLNSFVLSAFLASYLHVYHRENYSSERIFSCVSDQNLRKIFSEKIQGGIKEIHETNSRSLKQIDELLLSDKGPEFLLQVAELHRDILEQGNPELIRKRITDIFVHSLKHALKSACITLGGFENERDVLGWVELSHDFEKPAPKICLFEQGMYGTGGFRTIYQKFKSSPLTIWNHIFSTIENCPTAHDETILLSILSKSDDICEEISRRVHEILSISGTDERDKKVRNLLEYLHVTSQIHVEKEDVAQILRVFEPPLELDGQNITNWKLYKELNVVVANELKKELERTPSSIEIKEKCYQSIIGKGEKNCPSWIKLSELLQSRSSDKSADIKYPLYSEMDRRLLNTCVDGCPSCLKTECNLDNNPKSKHLLLSRRLLELALNEQKDAVSLKIEETKDIETTVKKLLDTQCLVYIQYREKNFGSLSHLIAQTVGEKIISGGKTFMTYVHSDTFLKSDKVREEPVYELCLALKEISK